MRFFLFNVLALLLATASCKKNNPDLGTNYWVGARTNTSMGVSAQGTTSGTIYDYWEKLNGRKIVKISSSAELDSLGQILGARTINGTTITASQYYQNFDFTTKTIFAFEFEYYSTGHAGLGQPHLAINTPGQSMDFTMDANTEGAGSGMTHFANVYFFEVHVSQADYTVTGSINVSESGMWSGDDYVATYSQ